MLYKTMVLGLLQERRQLHKKLRQEKILLKAMEFYASELKDLHEAWKQHLSETNPGSDESRIASQALELALQDLEGILPSGSSTEEADRPTLNDFMNHLRERTLPV